MRTTIINRRAAGFAAAVTAALALAACGPADAPKVAAPSVPPTSAASPPSSSSSDPAPSSDSGSSSSSPSSAASGASGGVCETSSSIGPTFTASVATKPFGTTVQVTDNLDRSVEISPSKPRAIAAAEGSYLKPKAGMQFVAVDVRAHLVKGYSLYMSYIAFNLYDSENRTCYRTSSSELMSEDQQLRGTTLNSTTTDTSGAVLFEIPAGADLNSFTLGFTSSLDDVAQAQWKG